MILGYYSDILLIKGIFISEIAASYGISKFILISEKK